MCLYDAAFPDIFMGNIYCPTTNVASISHLQGTVTISE